MPYKIKNELTGRYGKLIVIKRVENHYRGGAMYLCLCDCGNKKPITASNLKRGKTKSCGCINHGYSKTPIYKVWQDMKSRCYRKKDKYYNDYGGRGIRVCDQWLLHPLIFIRWCLNNGWKYGLEIDRVNNDGNYEPNNCRFVTRLENVKNQRLIIKSNTSGYRGVSYHKIDKKWHSRVSVNKKLINIGRYDNKIEAALMRDVYVIKNNVGLPLNFSFITNNKNHENKTLSD